MKRQCAAGVGVRILLAVLFGGSACSQPKPRQTPAVLAPLEAASWLVDLDVPGFGKAKVALPLGATGPRAIVIALHGVADRPEWACSALRAIAGPRPFVLCPRGVARTDFAASDLRFTFGTADDTERELRAALTQLKRRFGPHVASGPVVFAGFEIGADHAAWIARQEPTFFSRLLLIDLEPGSWPSSQSALFGRGGGERVLFATGPEQRNEFEQTAVLTGRAGAGARVVLLEQPQLGPPTVRLLRKQWSWLVSSPGQSAKLENGSRPGLPVGRPTATPTTARLTP